MRKLLERTREVTDGNMSEEADGEDEWSPYGEDEWMMFTTSLGQHMQGIFGHIGFMIWYPVYHIVPLIPCDRRAIASGSLWAYVHTIINFIGLKTYEACNNSLDAFWVRIFKNLYARLGTPSPCFSRDFCCIEVSPDLRLVDMDSLYLSWIVTPKNE